MNSRMRCDAEVATDQCLSLREVAACWYDRMNRESASNEARAEFERWLEDSAGNRAAYEAVSGAWSIATDNANDPRLLALRHETALRLTRELSRAPRAARWATAACAVACLGLMLGLISMHGASLLEQGRQVIARVAGTNADDAAHAGSLHSTKVGERLTLRLEDGSQVTLNTNSVLRVDLDSARRRVVLVRGQALFEVAKDPLRPFVVETPDRRFVALGTAFDVRLDGKVVQVTMLEGTVRVERVAGNHGSAGRDGYASQPAADRRGASVPPVITTLTAGEQLIAADELHDRVRTADAQRVTSWRRGQLIFEDSLLAEAVAELNRYSDTRIRITDPTLEQLHISGAFATGRQAVFIEAITTYFPVRVTTGDDATLLLSWREPPPAAP